jgi:DNA mismatch endonuclease (patch repair protein)
MILPKYRAAIFIHGCFWHGHDCRYFRWPKTRRAFWREKIVANRKRDAAVQAALQKEGWRSLVIWECAMRGRGEAAISTAVEQAANWLTHTRTPTRVLRGD